MLSFGSCDNINNEDIYNPTYRTVKNLNVDHQ